MKYLLNLFQDKTHRLLILILLFTFFSRIYNLDYPKSYVFDEVYHAFTAKEYLKGSKDAWNPFATPPKGVAFEWTHPPLAKELMTTSMFILRSTNSWAWRIPGVLAGTISVYLVFALATVLFKNPSIGLLSAFIFSLDGLNFVQSRTGMNDSYLVVFTLASLLFFIRKNLLLSAFFFGLALASKWAAIYLFGIYILLLLWKKEPQKLLYFFILSTLVYLFTYIPYFSLGYNLNDFIELQKQMWWYHTNLKATHDYASPWWSWPLNLYPVWYFVDYHPDGKISNIFASGNSLVFWSGITAILFVAWEFIKKRSLTLLIILLGYFAFILPWALSPRIMFLYHYIPSLPFLSLALGYQLSFLTKQKSDRLTLLLILSLFFLSFIFFYPLLSGIPLPKELLSFFFRTNLTKNPF